MVINFYSTWSIVKELEAAFQYSSTWRMDFVVAQASLFLVVVILLSTIMMIIHRSLGPIPRIEAILERVAQGDYSMRVTVRKKDFLISFIDKLNKVLELLEQKTKGS
jgi:methyl-accepting chemotaxis protein